MAQDENGLDCEAARPHSSAAADNTAISNSEKVAIEPHVALPDMNAICEKREAGHSDMESIVPTTSHHKQQSTTTAPASHADVRRRLRRKRSEQCEIEDCFSAKKPGLGLPMNQYERTLIRRALRKADTEYPTTTTDSQTTHSTIVGAHNQLSTTGSHGDVSLGMKLTVIAGKVIVQNVTSLADGRASPAQLAGFIRRGDVLLAINDYSLVNLPFDQLMRGLGPLSTPDVHGLYQRKLKLRFLADDGVGLLERNEADQEAALHANQHINAANEMFGLFPMVDQLGGFHYGENDSLSFSTPTKAANKCPATLAMLDTKEDVSSPPVILLDTNTVRDRRKIGPPLDETIAKDIAANRLKDRERQLSEFFAWNDHVSELLRPSDPSAVPSVQPVDETTESAQKFMLPYILERGKRALIGAKALSDRIESIDCYRPDVRSFKSWTTTLSLYSRASTRRKMVFDGASLPVNFGRVDEHEDEDGDHEDEREAKSDMSAAPGIDADEFLVQMAAHDEVWRKQVVEFFLKYIRELDAPANDQQASVDEHKLADMDTALSNELGDFLFGDRMSRIMRKGRKSLALPPEDVTLVLFDLTTKVCASIPIQITAAGSIASYRSSLTPTAIRHQSPIGSDAFLATHFLLDEALPLWLKSFQPLLLEQRRILWPLDRERVGCSTTASTLSDELSMDSMSASQRTRYQMSRKKKNLRERIEEQELDVETKTETCFLTTFYLVQSLLPKLASFSEHDVHHNVSKDATEEEVIAFITRYGSYLKMHTCFVCASRVRSDRVTDALLGIARHDPRHREVMKQLANSSSLLFYEPTMLSAVVQLLATIRSHNMKDRRLSTIDLCVSAFPDVSPGQIRDACGVFTPKLGIPDPSQLEFDDLYYIYLSQLLHPVEGHEAARRNESLVEEWCRLSILGKYHGSFAERPLNRMANFLSVTSNHVVYRRNIVALLEMAMDAQLYNVSMDLAAEIVYNDVGSLTFIQTVLGHLKTIALNALEFGLSQPAKLRKILSILNEASHATIDFDVPEELCCWINHESFSKQRAIEIVRFLANTATPTDMLAAILQWIRASSTAMEFDILPALRTILSRATGESLGSELSASLLQLRRAQPRQMKISNQDGSTRHDELKAGRGIWERLSSGTTKFCK